MTPKLKYFAVTLALFFALSMCFERPAHAYVDPGSSLLAYQTISAMVTGGLFYFRRRLKSLLSPKSDETDTASSSSAELSH
jgi:hypothetical protein